MNRETDPRVFERNFAMEVAPTAPNPLEMPSPTIGANLPDTAGAETPGVRAGRPGWVPSTGGGSGPAPKPRNPVETRTKTYGKPFAFALAHGDGGASIWHGCLLANRCVVNVKKVDGKIVIASQASIPTTEYIVADNLEEDTRFQTHLGWYGDVYGYWETDEDGAVTLFEISGPDEPDGEDISELTSDLERTTAAGKYYVLIGTVEEDSPIDQKISSDIPWSVTILKGAGGSSSSISSSSSKPSSGGSSSKSSSGGSSSGSRSGSRGSSGGGSSGGSGGSNGSTSGSKSTAIVADPLRPGRNIAWFCMEMPELVFEDLQRVEITGRVTRIPIDPRVVGCCQPGTMAVTAVTSPVAATVGGCVGVAGDLEITTSWLPWRRPRYVWARVSGIRLGYLNVRFPDCSAEERAANDEFWAMSRPPETDLIQ